MPGYMGDSKHNIVHHLANVQKDCGIYYVEKQSRVYFTPDIPANPKLRDFSMCPFCMPYRDSTQRERTTSMNEDWE